MENYLRSFQFLTDTDIEALNAVRRLRMLNKGDYLIKAGRISTEVAFVRQGLLRSYYTKDNGEEITYCFTFEDNFMTAYSSLITGQPTYENIQALVPTELWILQKSDLESLGKKYPNWVLFQKYMAEQQYIDLETRFFSFQKEKASERYQELLQSHPRYFQQIPLQHLASYLGISQRHLTRIRREISLQYRTNVL